MPKHLLKLMVLKFSANTSVNQKKIFERFSYQQEMMKGNTEKTVDSMSLFLIKSMPFVDKEDRTVHPQVIYLLKLGSKDAVVNQLLTNLDGVEALNNIIVIGMTNRKDLLD